MTDSTRFPTRPMTPAQTVPPKENPAQVVKIITLPEGLKNLSEAIRLRGEVIRENRDGTVTIKTERGEVDVKPPEGKLPPQKGEKVDIEIPAGRPPTQASVKPAPPDVIKPQPQTPPAPQPSKTPVNVEVGVTKPSRPVTITPEQIAKPQSLPQELPPPGSVVMAKPVSTKEAAAIITQTQIAQTIINAFISAPVEAAEFTAQIIAQKATAETLNQTLNITAKPADIATKIVDTVFTLPASETTLTQNPIPQPLLEFLTQTLVPQTQDTPQAAAPITTATLPPLPETVVATPVLPTPAKPETPQAPLLQIQTLQTPVESFFNPLPFNPMQNLVMRIESIDLPDVKLSFPVDEIKTEEIKTETPVPITDKKIVEENPLPRVSALITGLTENNLPLLSFVFPQTQGVHHFVLQAPVAEIIPGTQLQVTPLPVSVPGVIENNALASPLSSFLQPGTWQVMQEMFQTLTATQPALAQVLSNVVPNATTPSQITPAALFFIAAVRAGDIGGWLGDKTIDALRRTDRGGLLSRLTQEGSTLNRLSSEPVTSEWRAMPLPMVSDGEIHKMALYWRNENEGEQKDGKKTKQTRFIFDLNLSRMGKVQLDGLFREKRLDVILRTEERFNEHTHAHMRKLYAKALSQTEFTGELSFQNNPEQWITIDVDKKPQMESKLIS